MEVHFYFCFTADVWHGSFSQKATGGVGDMWTVHQLQKYWLCVRFCAIFYYRAWKVFPTSCATLALPPPHPTLAMSTTFSLSRAGPSASTLANSRKVALSGRATRCQSLP